MSVDESTLQKEGETISIFSAIISAGVALILNGLGFNVSICVGIGMILWVAISLVSVGILTWVRVKEDGRD